MISDWRHIRDELIKRRKKIKLDLEIERLKLSKNNYAIIWGEGEASALHDAIILIQNQMRIIKARR